MSFYDRNASIMAHFMAKAMSLDITVEVNHGEQKLTIGRVKQVERKPRLRYMVSGEWIYLDAITGIRKH